MRSGWPEYWRAWWDIWRKGWILLLSGGWKNLTLSGFWDCNAICHCWKPFIWLTMLQGAANRRWMPGLSCPVKYVFPGGLDREEDLGWVATDSSVLQKSYVNHNRHMMILEVPLPVVSVVTSSEFITVLFDCQVFSTLLKVASVMIGKHHFSSRLLSFITVRAFSQFTSSWVTFYLLNMRSSSCWCLLWSSQITFANWCN